MWHIANLFLLTAVLIWNAVYYVLYSLADADTLDYAKYQFYFYLSVPVSDLIDIYVGLFLLWLLYKFMKPY